MLTKSSPFVFDALAKYPLLFVVYHYIEQWPPARGPVEIAKVAHVSERTARFCIAALRELRFVCADEHGYLYASEPPADVLDDMEHGLITLDLNIRKIVYT